MDDPTIAACLRDALTTARTPDPIEGAASFGRWWHDADTGQMVLSTQAAEMLGVDAGWHQSAASCFAQVVPEDVWPLTEAVAAAIRNRRLVDCAFRSLNRVSGLRWQRLASLPPCRATPALMTGIVVDCTAANHAAVRERLCFASTQLLVGSETFGDAVTQLMQLVCENLGWEWGAYWALEPAPVDTPQLVCQHFWHRPQDAIGLFLQESLMTGMAPGAGVIGQVWQTGAARWIEDMPNDPAFLRQRGARQCRLQSGYVFPVVYVTEDGVRHSPGVLEFYSRLSRQSEAQLPNLSVSIGALVAQTAQRLQQQDTMRQLAQRDGLTQLANRGHFHQLLDERCANATACGTTFGLLFIDLDRFKPVNDAYGHDAGNSVLRDFAHRMQAMVPTGSTIGRLGGDEFAILLQQSALSDLAAQLDMLATSVLRAARLPFMFERQTMSISASIGISVFPDNGTSGPELLRSADAAMYAIKKNGRNALGFFSDSTATSLAMQQTVLAQRMAMETALHEAVRRDELYLEYQPIFDGAGTHLYAVEALVRWRTADGEVVRPDVFIPIAEQSRLIVHIGRWVVRQACSDLARLHKLGFDGLIMHVNMAAPEFTDDGLPDALCDITRQCGIAPRYVCLELTENLLMQQPDKVIPIMHALRTRGFGIGLDDFGVGYSSLARLKKLPISSMKIDRSFMSGLPHQRDDRAIARTIIELGRNLDLHVIAEGVETDEQLAFLRQYGCTLIQGYLLSRPKPIGALIAQYGSRVR